jgi:hypothetical protein
MEEALRLSDEHVQAIYEDLYPAEDPWKNFEGSRAVGRADL